MTFNILNSDLHGEILIYRVLFYLITCSLISNNIFGIESLSINALHWEGYLDSKKMDTFKKLIKESEHIDLTITTENITNEKMLFNRTRSKEVDLIFPGIDIVKDNSFRLIKNGLVQPIDIKLLKNFSNLEETFQRPSFLMQDNKIYGITFASGEVSIFYNYEKIQPKNLDQLLKISTKGKIGTVDFSPHIPYVLAMAMGISTDKITDYNALSKNTAFIDVLNQWGKKTSILFNKGVDNAKEAKDLQAFIGWGFALSELKEKYNQDWRALEAPAGILSWLDNIMIPSHVKGKKLAIIHKLIDYLISEEYQSEIILKKLSSVPVNKLVFKDLKETPLTKRIIELHNKEKRFFLPPLSDRRSRNGLQKMWNKAKQK